MVVKESSAPEFTSRLFELCGAEVQTFCETSLFPGIKSGVDLNWSNSDFVKAHVYASNPVHLEVGEREIDLTVDGDMNLLRNVARDVDVFIDSLKPNRLEELGLDPEKVLQQNPQLIFARIPSFNPNARILKFEAIAAEEAMEIGSPRDLGLIGHVYGCVKIMAALLDRHTTGKGQVTSIFVKS